MEEIAKGFEENEDIEKEIGNENIQSEIPFNPSDISINIIPRTIGQIVEMIEYDEILVPKYQRLPNLWDDKKKSRFIESLMLNLPIPLFYFDEGEDKKWRVIDGLQRVSTLEHFILGDQLANKSWSISKNKGPLVLCNLEFKTEFNGKTWYELPKNVQRRIQTNQITINLIGKGTPDQVKYNIFSRINQGGVDLEPQEIRTALFQGYRNEFLEYLVSEDSVPGKLFQKATNNSISKKRQEDLDFATRFISFYLKGYKNYVPDMDTFLTLGTKVIPQDKKLLDEISKRFSEAMALAYSIFEKNAFRKINTNNNRRKPINKPLFEVISVAFSKLNKVEIENIVHKKDFLLNEYINLQNDTRFWNAITTGTATKQSVEIRHEEFEKLLNRFKS
jgi:hypothetical protein